VQAGGAKGPARNVLPVVPVAQGRRAANGF